MKSRSLSFVLLFVLLIASLSCSISTSGKKRNTQIDPSVTITPPNLPQPPAALHVSEKTPEERAAAFSQAIDKAPDPASRLSAWLGLYDALGIPVLDETGVALGSTKDDPAGAPYWVVWYSSGMSMPRRGMTLADAGKILTAQADGKYEADAGQTLLTDLRKAVQSSDPQIKLLGAFVRQRILNSSSALDLQDTASTPEAMVIDPATVWLLQWAQARNTLAELAKAQGASSISNPDLANFSKGSSYKLASNIHFSKASSPPRCAEMFGSEDTTAIVSWLANKIYSGASIPLVGSLPGLTEITLKQLGVSKNTMDKVNKFTASANAIATLMSFYMQVHALQIDWQQDPLPLERTKTTSDGKRGVIHWYLFYDKNKVPDGNELWACMTNFVSNTFGIGLQFPPSEGIGGAKITFAPGKNVPEKVLIDADSLSVTTDSQGKADLKVIGRAQKKEFPDSAPPYDDEFILHVSAQPEPVTGNSLVNMFVDSLTFWGKPNPLGIVSPITDILKTLSYDLGEVVCPMIDWEGGYQAQGGQDIAISGMICNGITNPFNLHGDTTEGGPVEFSYTPTSASGGSYTYEESFKGFTAHGTGNYTLTADKNGVLTMTQNDYGCVDGIPNSCASHTNTVTLTPTDACGK